MRHAPVLFAALAACSSSSNAVNPPPPPPPPAPGVVASVGVAFVSPMVPGATQTAAATLKDATGATLVGRAVTWNSSNLTVATVDGLSGLMTAVADGNTTIMATSGGISGSAQLTVATSPVVSIQAGCPARIKAGEPLQCTVGRALRANGTAAAASLATWQVASGPATITSSGVITGTGNGTVVLLVTIEGFSQADSTVAYDWIPVSGAGVVGVSLVGARSSIPAGEGPFTDPVLTISCSSGVMDLHVLTGNIMTQDTTVSYFFDNGAQTIESWAQTGPPAEERHPGPNAATRALATKMAAAKVWGFAFVQLGGAQQSMTLHVTGLSALLDPILNACPG
jgi:hypothetical protein